MPPESCLWLGEPEEEEVGDFGQADEHDLAPEGADDETQDDGGDDGSGERRSGWPADDGENDEVAQDEETQTQADEDASWRNGENAEEGQAQHVASQDSPGDELLGVEDFEGQALVEKDVPAAVVLKRIERLTEARQRAGEREDALYFVAVLTSAAARGDNNLRRASSSPRFQAFLTSLAEGKAMDLSLTGRGKRGGVALLGGAMRAAAGNEKVTLFSKQQFRYVRIWRVLEQVHKNLSEGRTITQVCCWMHASG